MVASETLLASEISDRPVSCHNSTLHHGVELTWECQILYRDDAVCFENKTQWQCWQSVPIPTLAPAENSVDIQRRPEVLLLLSWQLMNNGATDTPPLRRKMHNHVKVIRGCDTEGAWYKKGLIHSLRNTVCVCLCQLKYMCTTEATC